MPLFCFLSIPVCVSFMDSTGVGLLIGRYKKLKQLNVPAYISGASVATEKVIELGLVKGKLN